MPGIGSLDGWNRVLQAAYFMADAGSHHLMKDVAMAVLGAIHILFWHHFWDANARLDLFFGL